MIHRDVFRRFVEDSPGCVMVQTLLENVLSPTTVDALFERRAVAIHPRPPVLPTSSIRHRPPDEPRLRHPTLDQLRLQEDGSGSGRYQESRLRQDRIDRVETTTSAALVRHSGSALGAIIDALGSRHEPWL
ncbi:MAG: hypothetical protein IRY99_12395 [Isosphaeraceae bacterium]|nr:hypothetical protein [Isosphaeraceae bacterium]